jgi:hypothetical protein
MMRCPMDWEIYRRPAWTDPSDLGDRGNGNLIIPARQMCIVFSNGEGWEHVSVSVRDRCPTWDEMEDVKRPILGGHRYGDAVARSSEGSC